MLAKPIIYVSRISYSSAGSLRKSTSFLLDKAKTILPKASSTFSLSKKTNDSLQTITLPPTEFEDNIRDRFIPFSRYTIIREIIQDKSILPSKEKEIFQNMCLGLDTAVHSRYYSVLQELKSLFDPVNADNDNIIKSKTGLPYGKKEQLDNEFWLFQRLHPVMERAGFHELSRAEIEQILQEKTVPEGVTVSVEPSQYDTLKMWVLGRESSRARKTSWLTSILLAIKEKLGFEKTPKFAFKRVVVGVRLKSEDFVQLKMFSDIPSSHLQHLLPVHRIRMNRWDKYIFTSLFSIGTAALLMKGVAVYFALKLQWSWLLTGGAAILAMRLHTVHYERRSQFLKRLNDLLYSHGLANNRGLLTLLIDRAQDEEFKGALLIYSRLLASPDHRISSGAQIEKDVEEWLRSIAGPAKGELESFQFESEFSLSVLEALGLVVKDVDGSYRAIDLQAAAICLPVNNKESWFTGHIPSRDNLGFLKPGDISAAH